ncbi:hypothetical protein SACC_18190 [Saccharolobus caldissimus]|uniref:CobQ/CobB/MinD/ParA nucleotide binding domain-containing protein n=2 Tax=Saccharolobus caldissimus TaxID=1702097 RepID=A0AAQ4CSM1_9CREN|nr:hypothetical protein SACC_18190 [Saccharolobus caldissimus]
MILVMKRIDIVSVKGGVGKSFIAYFLTKKLSENYNVLLLDKDLTSTISKVYNIRGNLVSFLSGNSFSSDYSKNFGNLTIINLGCSERIKRVEATKLAEVYSNFSDHDFFIVDNPSIPSDICLDKELEAYYTYLNEKRINYNLITVLPSNQVLLDESVAFLKIFEEYIKELGLLLGYDSTDVNFLSSIINMYNSRLKINIDKVYYLTDKIIKIPFIKEAIYTPLSSLPMPKEINQLIEYIL